MYSVERPFAQDRETVKQLAFQAQDLAEGATSWMQARKEKLEARLEAMESSVAQSYARRGSGVPRGVRKLIPCAKRWRIRGFLGNIVDPT